jgi:hypothetical protein
MAWAYVISSFDRRLFKRCRRAWDLGSPSRQNYEPLKPLKVFDFEVAIREALAVYYFPGMWEWNREIVRPLALEGFLRSMREQRDHFEGRAKLSAAEERGWGELVELGQSMLKRYFDWAGTVDLFSPIRVETVFDVNIPDHSQPGRDLMVAEGVPIRYRGRIELLAMDGSGAYWIVEHRVVREMSDNINRLLLDEQTVSYCWAWEKFFIGMKIAGIIYNELLAGDERQSDDLFRRTQVPVSRARLQNIGRQLELEALEIANPDIRVYPNPSGENCSNCAFVEPCIAMSNGSGVSLILETSYRKKGDEEVARGRIGASTWSVDRGAIPPSISRRD